LETDVNVMQSYLEWLATLVPSFILSACGLSLYTLRVRASAQHKTSCAQGSLNCGFVATRQVVARTEALAWARVQRRIMRDSEVVAFFANQGVPIPSLQYEVVETRCRPSRAMRSGYSFYREV
jgi:hypothetical protein